MFLIFLSKSTAPHWSHETLYCSLVTCHPLTQYCRQWVTMVKQMWHETHPLLTYIWYQMWHETHPLLTSIWYQMWHETHPLLTSVWYQMWHETHPLLTSIWYQMWHETHPLLTSIWYRAAEHTDLYLSFPYIL